MMIKVSNEKLKAMSKELDVSCTQVVRNALSLYEAVLREHKEGRRLVTEDQNGRHKKEIMLL